MTKANLRRHPNLQLWETYEQHGLARGRLVAHIMEDFVKMDGASMLDFGCGTGGISVALAEAGARVTAFDPNEIKLAVLRPFLTRPNLNIEITRGLPVVENFFDGVILSDVIEHLLEPEMTLRKINTMLKPGGLVFLSTPNKLSLLNALLDPHFSLPLISLFKRKWVKKIVANFLRWQPKERLDFPELLSLKKLDKILRASGLAWQFVNVQVAEYAFQHPTSVWNRPSHLRLVEWLKKCGLPGKLDKIISDKINFVNTWLFPTWYLIAQKKPDSKK